MELGFKPSLALEFMQLIPETPVRRAELAVRYTNIKPRGMVRGGDRHTFIFLKRKAAFVPHLSLGWQWEKRTWTMGLC